MIGEVKKNKVEKCPYIMLIKKYKLVPDLNMGYKEEYIYGEALTEEGTIIPLMTKEEYQEISGFLTIFNSHFYTTGSIIVIDAKVRMDYEDLFQSKRKRGKSFFDILHEISKEDMYGVDE